MWLETVGNLVSATASRAQSEVAHSLSKNTPATLLDFRRYVSGSIRHQAALVL